MYIAHYLLTSYGNEERVSARNHCIHCCIMPRMCHQQVTKLLESVEFIFIVFMNPDGYEVMWPNLPD